MNNQILTQGPRELIDAGVTIVTDALSIRALTDVAFTALVYRHAKTPASADVIAAGTIPAGQTLDYVKSISLTTGLAEIVYQFQ